MKINKFIVFCLSFLILINIAACKNTTDSTKKEINTSSKEQKTDLKVGEITDPLELEKLWQEYLYDSIASVCNARNFNSASEIDPNYVAIFCWHKYVKEHGKESLPLASEEGSLRLLPLDTVLTYAKHYFELSSLDLSKILDAYYDPERQAFTLDIGTNRRPSYTDERNSWGHHLEKVTRNSDGTVTAVMVTYISQQSTQVEVIKTLTFRLREDGSMYFVSGWWDYPNNQLVKLTGNYHMFDKITGFEGQYEELTMVGEADSKVILVYTPYQKGYRPQIMLLNPDKLTVEKKFELIESLSRYDVKFAGDNIVVKLDDKITVLDKTLEKSEDIPLPEVIREIIKREPKYDNYGNPKIFFGGYDISGDLSQIAYTDEIGLKLFDLNTNSEKLLSPTEKISGSKLLTHSYHSSPRFVDNDKKVITTMTGYECSLGYSLCDLTINTAQKINVSSEGLSTEVIHYDTGILEVNVHLYNPKKQTAELKTLYLDFVKGELTEIYLENPGETGVIREPGHCYVGQNYAAFVTYEPDHQNRANSVYYLNRLNLQTFTVESHIIKVTAAPANILGVLADGRIIFWYSLNPSEAGVCITK